MRSFNWTSQQSSVVAACDRVRNLRSWSFNCANRLSDTFLSCIQRPALVIHMLIKIKLYLLRVRGSFRRRTRVSVKIDIRYSRRWKWLLLRSRLGHNNMCVTGNRRRFLSLAPANERMKRGLGKRISSLDSNEPRMRSSTEKMTKRESLTFECWSTASMLKAEEQNTCREADRKTAALLVRHHNAAVNNLIRVYWLDFCCLVVVLYFFLFWWLMRHPHEAAESTSERQSKKPERSDVCSGIASGFSCANKQIWLHKHRRQQWRIFVFRALQH